MGTIYKIERIEPNTRSRSIIGRLFSKFVDVDDGKRKFNPIYSNSVDLGNSVDWIELLFKRTPSIQMETSYSWIIPFQTLEELHGVLEKYEHEENFDILNIPHKIGEYEIGVSRESLCQLLNVVDKALKCFSDNADYSVRFSFC